MAISKQFLKTKPECKIKFTLSAAEADGAKRVALLGDFNDWQPTATPMKKQKNGGFAVQMNLATGGTYKFRYLLDDQRWANDSGADGYEFCQFAGVENSIIAL